MTPFACAAFVLQLEGSVKSAQVLFARYDMDLDQRLKQQDYYDLMLELALALPYQEYQKFIEASFAYAGTWPLTLAMLLCACILKGQSPSIMGCKAKYPTVWVFGCVDTLVLRLMCWGVPCVCACRQRP